MRALLGKEKVMNSRVINSPALQVVCYYNVQDKIITKKEGEKHWEYFYDLFGHLIKVRLNSKIIEEYFYNDLGQRIGDKLAVLAKEREHFYLENGLYKANTDLSYFYDNNGNLFANSNAYVKNNYYYAKDCRICAAKIQGMELISYDYHSDEDFLPYQKRVGKKVVASYFWQDLKLITFFDAENNLKYSFDYENSRYPKFLTISGEYIKKVLGVLSYTFKCGTDQVGTLKVLSKADGKVFKEIIFDSFGNVLFDSLEELFIPISFAGGVKDKHTGFIRFGFRDYDPTIGRFVSQDPAYDMRGDGDLYDYCVDDPINIIDPNGLWAIPAFNTLKGLPYALALGKALVAGISLPPIGIINSVVNKDNPQKREEGNNAATFVAQKIAGNAKMSSIFTIPAKEIIKKVAEEPINNIKNKITERSKQVLTNIKNEMDLFFNKGKGDYN